MRRHSPAPGSEPTTSVAPVVVPNSLHVPHAFIGSLKPSLKRYSPSATTTFASCCAGGASPVAARPLGAASPPIWKGPVRGGRFVSVPPGSIPCGHRIRLTGVRHLRCQRKHLLIQHHWLFCNRAHFAMKPRGATTAASTLSFIHCAQPRLQRLNVV